MNYNFKLFKMEDVALYFLWCNIFFFLTATIRDPNNMPCAIKNFRVVMKDLHSQPPVLSVGKKMMHDAVSSNIIPANDGILMNTLKTENYVIKYSCKSSFL